MLTVSVILLILSGLIAVAAIFIGLGFGRKLIPGYRFRASGEEAVIWEKKFLFSVAAFVWSLAAIVALVGIVLYFAEWRVILISSIFLAAVVCFWVIVFAKGEIRTAAKKAKELSGRN